MDERGPGPTLKDGPVSLPEAPLVVPLDAQRLKNLGRDPRQFRARVHEYGPECSPVAGAGGVLGLDVNAEGSHVLAHNSSWVPPTSTISVRRVSSHRGCNRRES